MRIYLGSIIFLMSVAVPKTSFSQSCYEFYKPPTTYRSPHSVPFDSRQISRSIWKVAIPTPTNQNPNTVNLGTLFFISSQGHFIANMHAFQGQIKALAEKGLIDLSQGYHMDKGEIQIGFRQPLTMYNQETNKTVQINELFFNVIPKVKKSFEFGLPPETDFIVGRIDQSMDSWIPLRSGNLGAGETFYSLGYPYPDARVVRDISGADGRLKASSGKILKKIFTSLTTRDSFISNAPYAGGGSGSPAFNAKGELVGIATGGGVYNNKDVSSFVSSAAILRLIKKHRSLDELSHSSSRSPKPLQSPLHGIKVSDDGLKISWPEHLLADNAYEVFGIDANSASASLDKEIKTAFRRLNQKYHPDRANSWLNEIKSEHPHLALSEKDIFDELGLIFNKIKNSYSLIETSGLRAVYDLGRTSRAERSFFDAGTFQAPPKSEFSLLQNLSLMSLERRQTVYSLSPSSEDFTRMILRNYRGQPESIAVANQYMKEFYAYKQSRNTDRHLEKDLVEIFKYEMIIKSTVADINEGKQIIDLIAYQGTSASLAALNKILADLRFQFLDFKKIYALSVYARNARSELQKSMAHKAFQNPEPILLIEMGPTHE